MRVSSFIKNITTILLLAMIAMSIVACSPTESAKLDEKEEIIENIKDNVEESADESTQQEDIMPVVIGEMYTTAKVNVREEASMDGAVHCTLEPREVVQVTEIGEEWSGVLIDDNVYYISSQYLRERVE